jgi:hypothetical protein
VGEWASAARLLIAGDDEEPPSLSVGLELAACSPIALQFARNENKSVPVV